MEQALPEVPSNDPTRFCRLCFSQQNMHWVIRTFGTEVDLPFVNTIGECLGLWLSLEEDFPCAVCRKCFKQLEKIMQFRECSRRCDEAIRNKRHTDPSALVLFYDYPADKVFIEGSSAAQQPDFLSEDPDFHCEAILPEVLLDDREPAVPAYGDNRIRKSLIEKQLELKSYMDSYAMWSSENDRAKDDDEMTIAAPETMAQETLPQLSVLCKSYQNTNKKPAPQKAAKKQPLTFSTYTCCFCQQMFHTKGALNTHKKTTHNGSTKRQQQTQKLTDPPKCPDCDQVFPNVHQMRQHAVRHRKDLLITCPTCEIQFVTENELYAHLKNNGCRLKSFGKCEYCDRTFSRRGRYIFHLKNLHPDKPIPDPDQTRDEPRVPRATILPNPFSDIKRTDQGSNSLPIEEYGRFVVLLEPLSIEVQSDPASSSSGATSPDVENLVCIMCYERFDSLTAYNEHLAQCYRPDEQDPPPPPPPYELCSCANCMAVFEAVDPFVEHLQQHEHPLRIKPHDCAQCSITGQKPKFLIHPHSPSMILGD